MPHRHRHHHALNFCSACLLFLPHCVLCEAGSIETVERPSVRPFVCLSHPINRQRQRLAAGLLLSTPRTGDIDRQQAPALSSNGAAADAGSVVLTAEVRGCYSEKLWPMLLNL